MRIRNLTFRLATDSDAPAIALMSRDLIEHGLGWSWTRGRVARSIAHRETCTVVVCDEAEIVGFAIMSFGDEHGHLSLLAVRPSHQRKGVGRGLVQWLEESASVAGLTGIHLEVRATNLGARRFYRSLGFQELALLPRYYKGVEAAVWMARDLRSAAARQRV
jgi:ribosomal-protein-alanine N-acetyltransferase